MVFTVWACRWVFTYDENTPHNVSCTFRLHGTLWPKANGYTNKTRLVTWSESHARISNNTGIKQMVTKYDNVNDL